MFHRGVLLDQYRSSLINDIFIIGDKIERLRFLSGLFVNFKLGNINHLDLESRFFIISTYYVTNTFSFLTGTWEVLINIFIFYVN